MAASLVLCQASPAGAVACNSSAGAGYTVDVCIDLPLDGAMLSGDTAVAASVAVTGGERVAKLLFSLDSEYLLTDCEAPYEFTLPTATFADGPVTLLRVHVNSRHSAGFQVEEVADDDWRELSVTYAMP